MRTLLLILLVAVPLYAQNRLKWEVHDSFAEFDFATSAVVVGDNLIVAGTADTAPILKAYNKGTGAPAWVHASTGTGLASFEGAVFAAGNSVTAYNAQTGDVLWNSPGLGSFITANENAVLVSNGTITSAYDPLTGFPLWSVALGGPVALDGFNAFVAGSVGGSLDLRSFDARQGTPRWNMTRPDTIASSLAVGPNRLYVSGNVGGVWYGFPTTNAFIGAFETGSGDVLWLNTTHTGIYFGVGVKGNQLVAAGKVDYPAAMVSTFDAESGVPLWHDETYHPPGAFSSFDKFNDRFVHVIVTDDAAYIGGTGALETAWKESILRAYNPNRGTLIFEDKFNRSEGLGYFGGVSSMKLDGTQLFTVGTTWLPFEGSNWAIRAYAVGDIEPSHESVGAVGRSVTPESVEGRVRVRR